MLEKIKELWGKLPKEIKVSTYLIGAGLLNELSSALLGTKSLDLITFAKVSVANLLLVFIVQIKTRINAIK